MDIAKSLDLAVQHHTSGRLAEAEKIYAEILAIDPKHADALHLSGVIALQNGRLIQARDLIQQAIAINPTIAEYHNNLGNVFIKTDQIEEAIAAFQHATELRHVYPKAHSNLGNARKKMGQYESAKLAYRTAVDQAPDNTEARWNYSLLLLLEGDYRNGWTEFEHRLNIDELRPGKRKCREPRWDGRNLQGQRILIHAEQGFGDSIQFARYVPMLTEFGGKVILEIPPELHRLFSESKLAPQVIARGQPLPEFDVQCPLMSLPLMFDTSATTVPAKVPYLSPGDDILSKWKRRVGSQTDRLKVGIAWSGNPAQANFRNKSIPLAKLEGLAEVPGVDFYSLQVGPAAAELGASGRFPNVNDLTHDLHDFADTAGLMQSLDLIISIDTAVAHLAGALARPVWVLLSFVADWRFLLNRVDNPWYPTMRIFRQSKIGDWDEPVRQMIAALNSLPGQNDAL
jgi:TPR repeat/Tetratricopeptide repeat